MYGMVMSECTPKNGPVQLAYILSDRNRSDLFKEQLRLELNAAQVDSLLLQHNRSGKHIPADAAVLLWYQDSQQAVRTSLLPQFPAHISHLLPPGTRQEDEWRGHILVIVV